MDTFLYFLFTAVYIVLLILGIRLAGRYGWQNPANLILFVIVGLIYDNALLALGRYIGEGSFLEKISFLRYWGHALFTPMLVIVAWDALRKSGTDWAKTKTAAYISFTVTLALVLLELFTETLGLTLKPRTEYGIVSYTSAVPADGPPLMVLIISVILVVSAFIVWRKSKWIWMLIGSVLMVAGSAIPLPIKSGAVTNTFELILILSLLATIKFLYKHNKGGRF